MNDQNPSRLPPAPKPVARLLQGLALLGVLMVTGLSSPSTQAQAPIDHGVFDGALAEHVSNGHVNYPGFARDPRLDQYIEAIKTANLDATKDEKERMVFWINAYNALTIKGILNGGSPSSFFGRIGFFKGATYEAAGEEINLYDLEHEKLIPLGEPRIHFAINCASLSCPILQSTVYRTATLDEQLNAAAREFINDTTKNRFDREEKVAHLSEIFDWFEDDFGGSKASVLNYVAQFVADSGLAAELRSGEWRIEHIDYDWSLNGTPAGDS